MSHKDPNDSGDVTPAIYEVAGDEGSAIPTDPDYYPPPARFHRELRKAGGLYEAFSQAVKDLIGGVRVGRALDPSVLKGPLDDMIQSVIRHPDAMVWMRKLDNQHSYLTGHACRTSVLAAMIGRAMGMAEPRIRLLCMGTILMQIGKTKLPRNLLERPEPLCDEDTEKVRTYIPQGVEIVRECPVLGDDVAEIVQNHQERFDGSGYPNGKSGDAIPVLARIAGLVDWYDGMTTKKPYTERVLSNTEAKDQLYEQRGVLFQAQLVEIFIRSLGIYPNGVMVELNSGDVALVESQNPQNRTQPQVLIVMDRNGKRLDEYQEVDLLAYNRKAEDPVTIQRALAAGDHDLDPNEIMKAVAEQRSGLSRFNLGRFFGS